MSQLDYLWQAFGGKQVVSQISATPSINSIVSEQALVDYLAKYGSGITNLQIIPHETNPKKVKLVGTTSTNEVLSIVELDAEDHLIDVQQILSSQEEVNKGVCEKVDQPLLVFIMMSGKKYYFNIPQYLGGETNSITTSITNGKIEANLKIDNTLKSSCVEQSITDQGVRVDLKLATQDGQVKLIKSNNGLTTKFTWNSGDNILFDYMSLEDYEKIEPISGKIYFITDAMCIFLNGVKYGSSLSVEDSSTIKAVQTSKGTRFDLVLSSDPANLITLANDGLVVKLTEAQVNKIAEQVIDQVATEFVKTKDFEDLEQRVEIVETILDWEIYNIDKN